MTPRFDSIRTIPASGASRRSRRSGWPAVAMVTLAACGLSGVATASTSQAAPVREAASLLLCGDSVGCSCVACNCGHACRKKPSTLPLALAAGLVGAIGLTFRRDLAARRTRRTA